tara:strand:+ start:55 stop:1029 length:975 start_codon:yes stop_codon:yes gene_type:complete
MRKNVKLRDVANPSGSLNGLTTTYAGEFAGEYIAAALFSGNTLANGGVTIKSNVKYQEVIKKLAVGSVIVDGTCDFTTENDVVTLTERILTPEEFQVNLQLCKKDFRSDWEAMQMGVSAYDNLPPKFADYLIAYVAAKVAEKTEQNIWRGVTATAGEFDGFTTKFLADATVIDVPFPEAITSANVIAKMGDTVDLLPSSLYGSEDLFLYVSQNVAKAYVRALGGFAANIGAAGTDDKGTQWYNGSGGLSFDGINIFVANGLADNNMVLAQRSNLFFGTGLLSDQNEVKVLDMADLDGSQNVRMIMRFTSGVEYGIGSEIVYYAV